LAKRLDVCHIIKEEQTSFGKDEVQFYMPMREKIQNMPRPGLRNIKTAFATTFCIVLYSLTGWSEGVVLACIAVFICMQDSVDKSWRMGIDRTIGTLLGGGLAILAEMALEIERHLAVLAAVVFVGIVLYIFVCNLLKLEGSIPIGLTTYLVILIVPQEAYMTPLLHALHRTLDTIVGILVAVLVNMLLFRPRPERFRGVDTKNPVFHYEHKKAGQHKLVNWVGGQERELYIYPEGISYKDKKFDFRVAVSDRAHCVGEGSLHCPTGQCRHDLVLEHGDQVINLLTGEAFTGNLELLRYGEKRALTNGKFEAFYCLEDGAKLYLENLGQTYRVDLKQGDTVIVSWFENGNESYTAEVRHTEGETLEPLVIMVTAERVI